MRISAADGAMLIFEAPGLGTGPFPVLCRPPDQVQITLNNAANQMAEAWSLQAVIDAAELTQVGPHQFFVIDAGAANVRFSNVIYADVYEDLHDAAGIRAAVGLAAANLDTQLAALTPLNAAGVRAAVGLAAANLDTQLAAIGLPLSPAAVRAAIGMSAANLDTQLAAIGVPLTPAGIRQALGLAIPNLDAQFANIGPAGISPTGIRAALGLARPNLDEELTARDMLLKILLERHPEPQGEVVGSRR